MTPRLRLTFDFDSTLTTKDTLTALSSLTHSTSAEPWTPFTEAWMADFDAHKSNYPKPASERRSVHDEIKWQNSLAGLERASFDRVRASDLFQGVTSAEVKDGAERALQQGDVEFRRGWKDFILFAQRLNLSNDRRVESTSRLSESTSQHIETHHNKKRDMSLNESALNVISVNFSAAWVYHCIQSGWTLTPPQPKIQTHNKHDDAANSTNNDDSNDSNDVSDACLPIRIFSNEATPVNLTNRNPIEDNKSAQNASSEQRERIYIRTDQPIHTSGHKLNVYSHFITKKNLETSERANKSQAPQNSDEETIDRATDVNIANQQVKDENTQDKKQESNTQTIEVYIGDSPTDLQCLLAADIGICIRPEEMRSAQNELMEICERTGITTRSVDYLSCDIMDELSQDSHEQTGGARDGNKDGKVNMEKVIWYVSDFEEILGAIKRVFEV